MRDRDEDLARVDLILRQSVHGTVAILVITVSFGLLALRDVSPRFLIPWEVVLNLSTIYRAYLYFAWVRRPTDRPVDPAAWWWRIRGALLVSGVCWGTLGFWSPDFPPLVAMFAAMSIFGMTAGALASYAPDQWSMFNVLIPAAVGFATGLGLCPDAIHRTLAGLGVLYIALLVRSGRNLNRYVGGALAARRVEHERDVFQRANEAKLLFLAQASHEIRTPLAAINGFAESAMDNPALAGDARADLGVILRNGRHLVSVVNDLLDLTRADSGKVTIARELFDPSREVRACVELLAADLAAKNLCADVRIGEMPRRLVADPTRLRQIVINLLSNAVKYTTTGVIEVVTDYRSDAPSAGVLRVRVADRGRGIPAEARENIFTPFERAGVAGIPGAGLGLAVSRGLARRMGGDVRLVTSEVGVGSQFEVSIRADVAPGESDAKQSVPSDPVDLRRRRILIAEDDPDLRALMERNLARAGAEVTATEDGAAAVRQACAAPFDVILLDMKMPVMDGYHAASELRRRGYHGPVVALTAHASAADERRCLGAGCDRYLSKPVDVKELLGLLATLC